MGVTRIGPKHQITIPQDVFDRLGLAPGDFLQLEVRDDVLCAIPLKLIPRDQAWFWQPGWQQREQEADESIAQGEVSGPFGSPEELIRHLRNTR